MFPDRIKGEEDAVEQQTDMGHEFAFLLCNCARYPQMFTVSVSFFVHVNI